MLPLLPQMDRIEAASLLERRLAAMEALLTARRQIAMAAVEAVQPALPAFMQPPATVSAPERPCMGLAASSSLMLRVPAYNVQPFPPQTLAC